MAGGLPEWWSLDDAAARRFAEQTADTSGMALVDVRAHEFPGGPGRIALFERNDRLFSLVPGGLVTVGYDLDGFQPTPEQLASYQASAEEYQLPDIRSHVASVTTRRRTVELPTLVVAVEAVQSEQDDFEAEVESLAEDGLRLPTQDEWEWVCGAGAASLFRWGDDHPAGDYPIGLSAQEWPSAFGLEIGLDPYNAERTADPEIICGGDGGTMICGGSGYFLAWLGLATSYQDPGFAEFVAEDPQTAHDEFYVRPVRQLG
jgi:hypothetical protein